MRTIGLVGSGNAGRPIGERLLKKGYPLKVYDLNPSVVEPLIKMGAARADSPQDATMEVTIIVLPSSTEVRTAVFGQKGILAGIQSGFILIDLSGTDPDCARELDQKVKEKGGEYLGGTLHAAGAPSITIPQGLLSVVVGGKKETLEACLPILKDLGQKVICLPEPWLPKSLKMAVIMFAVADSIISAEVVTWLLAQGVDPKIFLQLLRMTGSSASASRMQEFFRRNKNYGGTLSNIHKDIRQVLKVAGDCNIPLPFTALAHQIVEMSRAQGFTRITPAAAFGKLYEILTGIGMDQVVSDEERAFPRPQETEVVYLERPST